jgi:hypothetical protein
MEMLTNTMKRNRVGTKQFKVWDKKVHNIYGIQSLIRAD